MPGSHLGLPELFSVHYLGCESHFSEHDLAFAAKLTKVAISDFFRSHFIFLSTSISHIPPPPLLQCTALSVTVWRTKVQKKRDFASIVVFSVPILYIFLSMGDSVEFLSNCGIVSLYMWRIMVQKRGTDFAKK